MGTQDRAGGHRKAKHTDYYTSPVVKRWSLEQTQLFLHMAAPPVGQAAEVRPALAFKDAGSARRRERAAEGRTVCVVGQTFNFTPFFHTLEVITARKKEHKTQHVLKSAVKRPSFYLVSLSCFESETSQLHLKSFFLIKIFFYSIILAW